MHTTVIVVDGLSGEDDIHDITNTVHELPGIGLVDVALATGTVSIEHSPLVSEADIRQALEDEGYSLR
ncbi:heavy-metal-associated domain-containing protein [Methyloversatilis thermotolerans]|jgi:copper chaperone CopZ|uniref:heavy-metal-associated domain-containing protein n=1 Tax=Methyloversatilis thermotolerans TaxID=1346290 RepID=UPI000364254A|nr:heavy metal-associated domain-containing protein [Methyloversatilis thermotolerans]